MIRPLDYKRLNVTLEDCDRIEKTGDFVTIEQNKLTFGSNFDNEIAVCYYLPNFLELLELREN